VAQSRVLDLLQQYTVNYSPKTAAIVEALQVIPGYNNKRRHYKFSAAPPALTLADHLNGTLQFQPNLLTAALLFLSSL
jgi:hypothetical protein